MCCVWLSPCSLLLFFVFFLWLAANVLFKTYGYISSVQAISFLSDFKLGYTT